MNHLKVILQSVCTAVLQLDPLANRYTVPPQQEQAGGTERAVR